MLDDRRRFAGARYEPSLGIASPSMRERADAVAALHAMASTGSDASATERFRAKGKLTAHERLELLFDCGTFREIESLRRHQATGFGLENRRPPGDGVATGWGKVHGRRAFAFATDARVFGGALGTAHAEKIQKVMDMARSAGAPLIAIHDGAGARVQEGASALAGYGGIFRRHVAGTGVVPQISVILGACAGGAAYAPALTDFVFMVQGLSQMVVTGPDVVAAVTGELLDLEALGGANVHGTMSGLASFVYDDEESCLSEVRYLLTLLPANSSQPPPRYENSDRIDRSSDRLVDLVPVSPGKSYDVRVVLEEVVDDGEYLEVQEAWASNIVCALARIDGHSVAFVANQPSVLAGALDIDSSVKAARFVELCDSFNIPIVTLVDVPGFLPGRDQERNGILRSGADLIRAYCAATVPRIQVILRKAYGGAYIVMDSRSVGADISFAWPTNEVGVMGADAAADVVFRREIANAPDPAGKREELLRAYAADHLSPLHAAERGLVDQVIDPRATRQYLAEALDLLRDKHPLNGPGAR